MSGTPSCRLHGVSRSYGKAFELRVPELGIARGEMFCVLGPTGAGKSTLLRILAGLEPPDAGEVCIEGSRLGGGEGSLAARRRLTMVFQRPLLLDATVRSNVEYGLRVRRLRRDARSRAEAVLTRLGLRDLADRRARTLSGGQVQLAAIARALAPGPEVLLLDEPTAGLDPSRVALVEEVVTRTNAEEGTTVVWVTHNVFQARRLARRAALLLDGRIVEIGPAPTLFEAPENRRTADFVAGRMIY